MRKRSTELLLGTLVAKVTIVFLTIFQYIKRQPQNKEKDNAFLPLCTCGFQTLKGHAYGGDVILKILVDE